MNLLYRRYRCFYENGLWYTLRKISWQLFGTLDPEKDDQWPVHKERFMKRHPKRFPAYASSSIMKKIAHDILIVSGVNETNVPQCLRYRVLHQVEQLTAAGFSVTWIPYEKCNKYTPLDCRAIIFYRCPFTEPIGEAIQMAKAINVRTYYDIDDLVFDKNYTDSIPTVQKLSRGERAIYDSGVIRMGATLKLCEYGITTTERLKEQMEKRVLSVFINRNCASEEMLKISERVRKNRKKNSLKNTDVIIGYFSGSLTHNSDFELILPALLHVMDENPEVKLLLMGELDLPETLKPYKARIIRKPFVDWRHLPEVIGSVDINLAPIENTIFNEAKSENKWVEASLVEVCTVASRVGAFAQCIEDGVTGFLCSDDEWYSVLTKLVQNEKLRNEMAFRAYSYCRENYVTTRNNIALRDFMNKTISKHIGFVLPSCEISGGIMVALWHACFLQDQGWEVDIIANGKKFEIWEFANHKFPVFSRENDTTFENKMWYDVLVATMWTTVDYVLSYKNVKKRCYLVQNYETDFYKYNMNERLQCEATYNLQDNMQYLTISAWCYDWLTKHYGHNVSCAQNGIQLEKYPFVQRKFDKERKVRILIEGDCAVDYKNVDESFKITNRLDRDRFEVWYMSYNANPKAEYRYDKFLHRVPYEKTPSVYAECDILLKSSWLESFSYPPIEMMATGGFCVVVPNNGNHEYLVDGENCLLYPQGDIDAAISAIEQICNNEALRQKLAKKGFETAEKRDWKVLKSDILKLYI